MTELLKKAYSAESFRQDAHELVDILADHIESCHNNGEPVVLPYTAPNEHYRDWRAVFDSSGKLNNREFWTKML